jgi:NADH-quinone oxidoreductase subunit J
METFVFVIAAIACLVGAVGVIAARNTVHAALSLVGTLFGVAVLFVAQNANFLAAVQVIVYAGAIVVLFLFVIMLLGVDRDEDVRAEPLGDVHRIAATVIGVGVFALPVLALQSTGFEVTGEIRGTGERVSEAGSDLAALGESLFTDYLYAFEITSVLLVIAIVGAVMLARRAPRSEEIVEPGQTDAEAALASRLAHGRWPRERDLDLDLEDDDEDDDAGRDGDGARVEASS